MFLISKMRLYLLFAAITVLLVLLTLNSYSVFVKLNPEHLLTSKYFAENIVFYAVITLIVLAILFGNTLARHKDILGELDKIVELARQSPNLLQTQVNKLGPLGQKIAEINANLNELNELKSLKISAQAALNEFIIASSSDRLLLTDSEGRVINYSRGLLEKLSVNAKHLKGKFVDELLPDTDLSKLLNNLRSTKGVSVKTRIIIDREEPSLNSVWAFFPILNSKSQLIYAVGILENASNEKEIQENQNSNRPISENIQRPDWVDNTPQMHIIDRISGFVRAKLERLKNDDNV